MVSSRPTYHTWTYAVDADVVLGVLGRVSEDIACDERPTAHIDCVASGHADYCCLRSAVGG